jgi:hypothetical protein
MRASACGKPGSLTPRWKNVAVDPVRLRMDRIADVETPGPSSKVR